MAQRVPLPGESAEECRKRVMSACQESWRSQSADAQAMRADFSQRAMHLNHVNKNLQLVPKSTEASGANSIVAEIANHKYIYLPPISASRPSGLGVLGLGDRKFGLAVDIVNDASTSRKGFVREGDLEWTRRAGGTIVSSTEFSTPMKLSCFEEFGFCWRDVHDRDLYIRIEKHLLRFIQDHRKRFLHKKKNTGPNADINQPLLIAFRGILDLTRVNNLNLNLNLDLNNIIISLDYTTIIQPYAGWHLCQVQFNFLSVLKLKCNMIHLLHVHHIALPQIEEYDSERLGLERMFVLSV